MNYLKKQILTGKPLFRGDLGEFPKESLFAVFSKDKFIGIYKRVKEGDIIARAEFVFN